MINLSAPAPPESAALASDREAVASLLDGLPDGQGMTMGEMCHTLGWNTNKVNRAIRGERFVGYRCKAPGHGNQIIYAKPGCILKLAEAGKVVPI